MRTKVVFICDDRQDNDFKKGDTGYVDGYLRGASGKPYAVVITSNDGRFVLAGLECIEAVKTSRSLLQ